MGYGSRDLQRIQYRICLDCKEAESGRYRRCLICRRRRAKARPDLADYLRRRRAENKAHRAAGRGNWPDIHGAI